FPILSRQLHKNGQDSTPSIWNRGTIWHQSKFPVIPNGIHDRLEYSTTGNSLKVVKYTFAYWKRYGTNSNTPNWFIVQHDEVINPGSIVRILALSALFPSQSG